MRVFPLAAVLLAVGLASAAVLAEEPDTGRLLGTVTSDGEAPLEALLVTASGPGGTSVATCDARGRFEFSSLHPGVYLLRAHASGFATAGRHVVEISSGLSTLHSMRLRRVAPADAGAATVLAAGVTSGLGAVSGSDWLPADAAAAQPETAGPESDEPPDRLAAAPPRTYGEGLAAAPRPAQRAEGRVVPGAAAGRRRLAARRGAPPAVPASFERPAERLCVVRSVSVAVPDAD